MRLGIMGGTFDPIHNGHLFIAEEARVRCRLDQVLFLPNGHPPHKPERSVTLPAHRLAMTQLAIQGNLHFRCSEMEIQRKGLSYTVDTLTQLHQEYPQAELTYITGVDTIADFLSWRRHAEVIGLATFVAISRPGYTWESLTKRLPADYLAKIQLLDSLEIGISSTEIRIRIQQGLPVRYLLPESVWEYVIANALYRN